MSDNQTSRFSLEIICAGLLKLLKDPSLLERYIKHINPELFYYGDKTEKPEALRVLLKEIIKIWNGTPKDQDKAISLYVVKTKMTQAAHTEEREAALTFVDWMNNDPGVSQAFADPRAFSIFIDYLKVTKIIAWSKVFSVDYSTGKIEGAIGTMRDLLPQIDGLNATEVVQFKMNKILDYLPQDNNTANQNLQLGCQPLDEILGGIERQTLTVFITPTNGGKSMMAHHIIRRAIEQRLRIHVICVEDRPASFSRRIVAALSGITIRRLKTEYHLLTSDELKLIEQAVADLVKYVHVEFVYGEGVSSLHQRSIQYDAECLSAGIEVPAISLVDYSAHIAHLSAGDKKYEQIHRAYADRKDFCLKHNKIGIDFAQINREGAKVNEEKEITHTDLAGGFDLAQVCDLIVSINRNMKQKESGKATLMVCKGRDNGVGDKFEVGTDFARARWEMQNVNHMNAQNNRPPNITNSMQSDAVTPIGAPLGAITSAVNDL